MKIEKYINDAGEFRCFGFSNAFFHKKDVREFVESLPEAKITFFTKAFGAEDFCEFHYRGEKFVVSEPYGDNSFYDVLCDKPDTEALNEIYEMFCEIAESRKVENHNKYRLVTWVAIMLVVVAVFSVIRS